MWITDRHEDIAHGMSVYELPLGGSSLTIRVVTQRDRYRVEARADDEPVAVTVMACGRTRAEALAEVARWWRLQEAPLHLPRVDWSDVCRVMSAAAAV